MKQARRRAEEEMARQQRLTDAVLARQQAVAENSVLRAKATGEAAQRIGARAALGKIKETSRAAETEASRIRVRS